MNDPTVSIEKYAALIKRLEAIRELKGTEVEILDVLRRGGNRLPFFVVRQGSPGGPQIIISAGTHGDEPAGVEAILKLLECVEATRLPIGITAFPCLNPTGYVASSRRNDIGYDLNRTFGQDPAPAETLLVRQAIAGRRFDFALDLHEDVDAQGFYLYEHVRGAREMVGSQVVERLRSLGFPIQSGDEIEGRALSDGCVAPADEISSPTNGYFSIYLFSYQTDHTLSTETPVALPLQARAAMHLAAIDYVIEAMTRE